MSRRHCPPSLLLPALLAIGASFACVRAGEEGDPGTAVVATEREAGTTAAADDAGLRVFFAGLPGAPLPEGCEVDETSSGLRFAVIKPGGPGEACLANDSVAVRYTGYLENGKVFDQTRPESGPARFAVGGVIRGWTEALELMTPGEKLKLFIPWELAYGERGYPGAIPARSNLIFEMELLSVERGPEPLPLPDFVMPTPDQLTTTDSGLGFMVVQPGSGASPAATDHVTVHYAGWLTDGTGFDNSFERGTPSSFGLRQVIPGWTEGLQLMSPGAIYVFVIPSNLAYGASGRPPTIPPAATLVFRVELLAIGG